jgi:CheY-like chemotaxis protein
MEVVAAPALWSAAVDPAQLEQVVLNLAVNARDAMPAGGRLVIEMRNVVLDEAFAASRAGVRPGPHVMLAVSDTGVGMDPETRARVFEPFFTTKPAGQGTGLGLATVYGIVKQSGGSIWVDSAPGRGTTFRIYLPRWEEAPGAAGTATRPASSPGGSEAVLLVEDDAAVRGIAREILERAGYRVLEADGPERALELAAEEPGVIHLLLTDVVMPRISGPELARRLIAGRPGLKVLYTSGYEEGIVGEQGAPGPRAGFVRKPFTPEQLRQKVREALEG